MIFVTSDLHGLPLKRFRELLKKAEFGKREDDFLFVLGDVIDRGEDGIRLLQWMAAQSNIQLILGNHEEFLLDCAWLLEPITEKTLFLAEQGMDHLSHWLANGAEPTVAAIKKLNRKGRGAVDDILQYVREAPLYETVSTEGHDWILTHAGLGNFSADKKLSAYTQRELLWNRPAVDERYFDDVTVVFGHTPTSLYGAVGTAFKTDTWIDIDTSDVTPTVLCLDTMQEFRLNN